MTSTRKIAANRLNASKSTGPRTVAGKKRSSRNGLRHGFNAVAPRDPAFEERAARLAAMIRRAQPAGFEILVREQALIIAEAEILLMRIHAARVAQIDSLGKTQWLQHGDDPAGEKLGPPEHFERFRTALPALLSYERYERRAISRRRKAIRTLDALRLLAPVS